LFCDYVIPRFQGHLDRTQEMQRTMRARRSADVSKYAAALDKYGAREDAAVAK
jgi:hypothetical protein